MSKKVTIDLGNTYLRPETHLPRAQREKVPPQFSVEDSKTRLGALIQDLRRYQGGQFGKRQSHEGAPYDDDRSREDAKTKDTFQT